MKLTNMKLDPKESESEMEMPISEHEKFAYPYGLKVCLDDDALEKLDLATLPKAGDALMLIAKVEVCSVAEYQMMDGSFEKRVELQITDLALEKPAREKSVEATLYGND